MKNLFLPVGIALLLLSGITACSDDPVKPPKQQETFPLTYKFLNKSDTTVKGGFEIRLGAYYPESDSSYYLYTGLNNPAVGTQLKRTFDEDNIGYPGVEMVMVFGAMKVWPDHWPDREPLYQTLKWFYIEKRTVEDSTDATMNFVWPQDTSRAAVHEFDPDTSDGDFGFDPDASQKFKRLFQKQGRKNRR